MSAYESLLPDEPADEPHPQRHNIVFPQGWPEEQQKVVLKARGRELELSKKTLKLAGGAAGAAAALLLLVRHWKKKNRRG